MVQACPFMGSIIEEGRPSPYACKGERCQAWSTTEQDCWLVMAARNIVGLRFEVEALVKVLGGEP